MAGFSHFAKATQYPVSRECRLIIIIVDLGVESGRRGFYAASIQEAGPIVLLSIVLLLSIVEKRRLVDILTFCLC
jgi:hypothetical protein